MPKALETPTRPRPQGSSHRRRIHGRGFRLADGNPALTRAQNRSAAQQSSSVLLYNTIYLRSWRLHRTNVTTAATAPASLAATFAANMMALSQPITHARGPLRLMSRRCESFEQGTAEPKQSSHPAVQGCRPAPPCQHACNMLARLSRSRDSPLAPDRAISAVRGPTQLARLTDHILTRGLPGAVETTKAPLEPLA